VASNEYSDRSSQSPERITRFLTQIPCHLLPLPIQVQSCHVSFLRYKELCRTAADLVKRNTSPYVSDTLCKTSSIRNMFKSRSLHAKSTIALFQRLAEILDRESRSLRGKPCICIFTLVLKPENLVVPGSTNIFGPSVRAVASWTNYNIPSLLSSTSPSPPMAALPTRAHCATTMPRSRVHLRCGFEEFKAIEA
jgi:hypothetical protein